MTLRVVLLVALIASVTCENNTVCSAETEVDPQDVSRNFTELCRAHGFESEQHQLTTDDGCILTFFRIPNKGPPVFFAHGFSLNADTWILPGPKCSIAYQLSRAGYDLWFPNFRNTKYGRKHTALDPAKDVKFWRFSFDEMAQYDLPAYIDYVLNKTGSHNLSYVGLGLGTTTFYAMSAHKPHYFKKVNAMVGLSPNAFMNNTKNLLFRQLSRKWLEEKVSVDAIGNQELFRNSSSEIIAYATAVCSKYENAIQKNYCQTPFALIGGYEPEQLRNELIPIIQGHVPDLSSVQTLLHLSQLVWSDSFRRYDRGQEENLRVYGSPVPPEYDLSVITTAVAHFVGENDQLSNPLDVEKIRKRLPNALDTYVVPRKTWGRVDFFWGTEAPLLVGEKIIGIFRNIVIKN